MSAVVAQWCLSLDRWTNEVRKNARIPRQENQTPGERKAKSAWLKQLLPLQLPAPVLTTSVSAVGRETVQPVLWRRSSLPRHVHLSSADAHYPHRMACYANFLYRRVRHLYRLLLDRKRTSFSLQTSAKTVAACTAYACSNQHTLFLWPHRLTYMRLLARGR